MKTVPTQPHLIAFFALFLFTTASVTERKAAAWALQLWRVAQNRGRLHAKFAALADRAHTRRLFRAWLERADARRFRK